MRARREGKCCAKTPQIVIRTFHHVRRLHVRFVGAHANFDAAARSFWQCGNVDAVAETKKPLSCSCTSATQNARRSGVTLHVEFGEPRAHSRKERSLDARRHGNVELEEAVDGAERRSDVFVVVLAVARLR